MSMTLFEVLDLFISFATFVVALLSYMNKK
ncbi:putative holin-like toxin [Clostridium sp. MD294]